MKVKAILLYERANKNGKKNHLFHGGIVLGICVLIVKMECF
jgi:hypothetical protein